MTDAPHMIWPREYTRIPKEIFVREDIYQAEIEAIFKGPEWHAIGHVSEVPNRGDFKTFTLAGTPLLILRGEDDVVRVFYNACSHRGTQIETEFRGNRAELECPYHRWMFRLNGELASCPGIRDFTPGFDKKDFPLVQPRMDTYSGMIFVTFSEKTEPLVEFLGDIGPTLTQLMGGDGRLKLLGYHKVRFDSNWKGYIDNDGYHAPLLHKAFALLNWQGGKGRQFNSTKRGHIGYESALSVAPKTDFIKDDSIIEFKGQDPAVGSRIVILYPLFSSVKHLDVINLRFATPLGVDKVEIHYAYFAHADDDADMIRHRIRQSSNLLGPSGMVSMEDASAFHRMHIGNHTPGDAVFQKGVRDPYSFAEDMQQNDETGQLPHWEYYREKMGFGRRTA